MKGSKYLIIEKYCVQIKMQVIDPTMWEEEEEQEEEVEERGDGEDRVPLIEEFIMPIPRPRSRPRPRRVFVFDYIIYICVLIQSFFYILICGKFCS